jgi:leader peptidase (prepilin peptidase) / N-methyltransferase
MSTRPYTSSVPLPYLFEFDAFLVGLLFGSLLNVCIVRLPRGESIVKPRSHCMSCGHLVRWYDNIPVLSWLLLRARCRDCRAKIPWRYPLVELAVGIWFYLAVRRLFAIIKHTHDFGYDRSAFTPALIIGAVAFAAFGFLLIGLMVMDWQTYRLPDSFTLTGTAIGFVLTCLQAAFLASGQGDVVLDPNRQLRLSSPGSFAAQGNVFLTGAEALIFGRIAAITGAALLLLTIRWAYKAIRKRDGLGLGDVKMLAMIAAFLGFSESLVALLIGVLTASLYGIALLALRRATPTTRIPFGSFLAIGGLVTALFGPAVVGWYTGLLR